MIVIKRCIFGSELSKVKVVNQAVLQRAAFFRMYSKIIVSVVNEGTRSFKSGSSAGVSFKCYR